MHLFRKDHQPGEAHLFDVLLLDEPAYRGTDLRCGPAVPGHPEFDHLHFVELSTWPDQSSAHQGRGRVERFGDKARRHVSEQHKRYQPSKIDMEFQAKLRAVVNTSRLNLKAAKLARDKQKLQVQAHLAAQFKLAGKRLPRKTSNAYKQLFAAAVQELGLPDNLSPPG